MKKIIKRSWIKFSAFVLSFFLNVVSLAQDKGLDVSYLGQQSSISKINFKKIDLNTRVRIFPSIPFKTEFRWTGIFGSTKDGLPYIGAYRNLTNSFFALGFGGNGITFSQVAGEIIASLIRGKKNKDANVFSFER